ncbi:MAG TPA: phospho-sugar mutase [Nocardioidaceae bacterium]|nr:phospho-sugar mutase [Nocardioidaceae bacterium]
MSAVPAELRRTVADWLADDPDDDTRRELGSLLERAEGDDAAALADLADRFAGPLQFGTAGLRGALGAGPNRMNRAVVVAAAAGLSAYLDAHRRTESGSGSVVIGYDARHKSDQFARDTAAVLRATGRQALVLPRPLPTPVLAFAIRDLGCDAGVMVTASHNPPRDNGYKVYLGDGSQIVPPADTEIAAAIDTVGRVSDVPRSDGWTTLDDAVVDTYVEQAARVVADGSPRDLVMAYTPLHGVGAETVRRVLARAGFAAPLEVTEQAAPDPDFPTVAFPNPEEPGAMDLAIARARQASADLAVANDPDADRCAVAVPGVHGWRLLRGDEVGVLLADHLLRHGATGVFATTIVSSSLLGKMAAACNAEYVETLTGFKWLGRVPGLRFGYEEALGYCVAPDLVRDKDGVTAILLVAEVAATLKAEGRTLLDRLDDIARAYGLHATDQLSVRVRDTRAIPAVMAALRDAPPGRLGGYAVERVDDLGRGAGGLPPTDGLRFRLEQAGRVVVRPSGTEPKLKCYLEVVVEVPSPETDAVEAARIAAAGRLDAIRGDLEPYLAVPSDAAELRRR